MDSHNGKLLYAEGTQILTTSDAGFDAAKKAAEQADLVILALGEDGPTMTGEAGSRAHLDLPGNQEQLLQAVAATGKPVVLIVFSGRPLVLDWAAQHVPAIMEAWFPGIEAGPALADLLFGNANPNGKLPVSFPRAVGQEPLYLAQMPTGRPAGNMDLSHPPENPAEKYVSRYVDVPNSPLFPFGYGLSYTQFDYSPVTLSTSSIPIAQLMSAPGQGVAQPAIEATTTVRNAGAMAGTEIVQLYIRIRGASVEEPLRVLKGFQRVTPAARRIEEGHLPAGLSGAIVHQREKSARRRARGLHRVCRWQLNRHPERRFQGGALARYRPGRKWRGLLFSPTVVNCRFRSEQGASAP